jgi:hypothetical protein
LFQAFIIPLKSGSLGPGYDVIYFCISFSTAPADYTGIGMNINLNPGVGQPGQMRFCENIDINNDALAEGNEFFTVSLSSLNPLVSINSQFSSAQVEIVDDDSKLGFC